MKLIIASPSPYARKARIALHEKALPFVEELTVPWNPGTVAPTHNPLGKIPILLIDDGTALYESSVILEYLDTIAGTVPLIPLAGALRVQAKLMEALADGVSDAVVLIALEARRKPDLQSRDWVVRQRAKVDAGLVELDRILGNRDWLVGDTFGLADIAAGSALGYVTLRLPEHDWRTSLPRLAAFSDRLEARPSFAMSRPAPQSIVEIG